MNFWHRFQQLQLRRKGRRQDKIDEQGMRQQWFLLAGADPDINLMPDPKQLNPLYPPANTFWADPFLWQQDGRYFIFFEDFPFATWRGRISVLEVDAQGRQLSEPVPVIEEPYHLSYPFLFEYDGQLYMMPEKCSQMRVDIYRCDEFPHKWSVVNTVIDKLKIVDSTLIEHDGRWWLFAAAKQGRVRINESLFAFYADSPLSQQWTAHPANPLVRDLTRGRPAGRIYQNSQGELLRPSQDCLRRYGYGIHLNNISELSTTSYQEQSIWHISGDKVSPPWRAIHHLDRHKGMMVMDAQRLIPLQATAL